MRIEEKIEGACERRNQFGFFGLGFRNGNRFMMVGPLIPHSKNIFSPYTDAHQNISIFLMEMESTRVLLYLFIRVYGVQNQIDGEGDEAEGCR